MDIFWVMNKLVTDMDVSPWLRSPFFVLVFSIFNRLASSESIPFSSYSVASIQHEFWSSNVLNNMPHAIHSKLSPLSLNDSQYFTSLASKTSFGFDANFCTLANISYAPNFHTIQRVPKGYFNFDQAKIFHDINLLIAATSHVDPFSYFRLSLLKQGKRVHLPTLRSTLPLRAFLPFQIASKISLKSDELKRLFPESFVSPAIRDTIEITLLSCQAPPSEGEIRNCIKSLEEMIVFSKNAVGQKHLLALTTKSTNGSGRELILVSIKVYDSKKIVSCHEVFLPFATYYCHLVSSTRLYAVDLLEPETKVQVNRVVAVCHMDTSQWPKGHGAFKLLKISPGKGEACHWLCEGDLAWIGAR